MVAAVLADARQVGHRSDAESASRALSPMPESSSSCGLCTVPALRITSRGRGQNGARRRPGSPRRPRGPSRRGCGGRAHRCARAGLVGRAPDEIGLAAAKAQASLGVALQIADALVLGAVVVGGRRYAGFGAGSVERVAQRIAPELDDVHRTMLAARAIALGVGLQPLEEGQHVVVSPTGVAEIAPMVVFARLPAHPQHAVDGR